MYWFVIAPLFGSGSSCFDLGVAETEIVLLWCYVKSIADDQVTLLLSAMALHFTWNISKRFAPI